MKEKFVGTWKLISWTQLTDGVEVPYFGPGAEGLLIYTADGHMSAHVMAADRPRMGMPPQEARQLALNLLKPWKARAGLRGVGALLNYFKSTVSYIAYAGTYDVDGGEVVHHVDMSLIPDWCGTDQRRRFRFEEDDAGLVLTVPPEGRSGEHTLIWTRI